MQTRISIQQALNSASKKFKKNKIKSAHLDAEILLSFILKKDKAFLYQRPDHKLTPNQLSHFQRLIVRRAKGEPIAYLTQHKEFYGLYFMVNKHVLIPRPETELLVSQVLKNKKIKRLAEIGTGCGCIAISLAKNNPDLKIYATEISASALDVAKKNSFFHKTNKKIIFKKGNLLQPLKGLEFDAIVANLPYLKKNYHKSKRTAENIGLDYEPPGALYAGPTGLELYQNLFQQIQKIQFKTNYIY